MRTIVNSTEITLNGVIACPRHALDEPRLMIVPFVLRNGTLSRRGQCSSRFGWGRLSALGVGMRSVAWSPAARWPTPAAAPHPDALRVEGSGKDFGERPEATERGAGPPSIPMHDEPTADRNDKLTVQLELGREPVTGCLRTEDSIEERFVGWLGFADALKRPRGPDSPSRPEREERR